MLPEQDSSPGSASGQLQANLDLAEEADLVVYSLSGERARYAGGTTVAQVRADLGTNLSRFCEVKLFKGVGELADDDAVEAGDTGVGATMHYVVMHSTVKALAELESHERRRPTKLDITFEKTIYDIATYLAEIPAELSTEESKRLIDIIKLFRGCWENSMALSRVLGRRSADPALVIVSSFEIYCALLGTRRDRRAIGATFSRT